MKSALAEVECVKSERDSLRAAMERVKKKHSGTIALALVV